jgi:hypothetical protein
LVYFLSNGVLIVSKTKQRPKKTSGIARLERGTQFPIHHFSGHSFAKRGPRGLGKDFVDDFGRHPIGCQFVVQRCPASVSSPRDIVLREAPIVEEVFV